MKLILASASPRRIELLRLITSEFMVIAEDINEKIEQSNCVDRVQQLALRKAEAIGLRPDTIIIGADTLVYAQGEILGKPKDSRDAARMLRLLSGRMHQVYTGVALLSETSRHIFYEETKVYFSSISEHELQEYLTFAKYRDKAGGYAIQSEAAKFITRIEGCYYNVMGFPVSRVYQALKGMHFEGGNKGILD